MEQKGSILVQRGEVFLADLDPVCGSEQGGVRPVLIIQNDIGNKFSPTVIVAAITSAEKKNLPTHIRLSGVAGLNDDSIVLMEQIRTLDKKRLIKKIGVLGSETLPKICDAIMVSVGCEGCG